MTTPEMLAPLETPESVLSNGYEFVYDFTPTGYMGAVAFAGYFADGKIPISFPDNQKAHDHDMLHYPYYVEIFGVKDFANTVRAGAQNVKNQSDSAIIFSTALDDIGDNKAFLGEWQDTMTVLPTTFCRVNVLLGYKSKSPNPLHDFTDIGSALRLVEKLGYDQLSELDDALLFEMLEHEANQFERLLELAAAD